MHFYYLFISSHFWFVHFGLGVLEWTFQRWQHFSLQNSRILMCIYCWSTRFSVSPSIRNGLNNWTNERTDFTMKFNVSAAALTVVVSQERSKKTHIFITFPPVSVRLLVRNEWNKTWSHVCSSHFIRKMKRKRRRSCTATTAAAAAFFRQLTSHSVLVCACTYFVFISIQLQDYAF